MKQFVILLFVYITNFVWSSTVEDIDEYIENFKNIRPITYCRLQRPKIAEKSTSMKYISRFYCGNSKEVSFVTEETKEYCSMLGKLAERSYWKNHAFLRSFCIETYMKQPPVINSDFFQQCPIDWMSNQCTSFQEGKQKYGDFEFTAKKSTIGTGHSECGIIQYIEDLFRVDSSKIVEDCLRQMSKESVSRRAFGFEILSSFDICDPCLNCFTTFFNKHKYGQESIFGCIQTKLEEKHIDNIGNRFMLIYQSQYPYIRSKYSLKFDEKFYDLTYQYKSTPQRRDIFRISKESSFQVTSEISDLYLDQNTGSDLKNGIYGYIHQIAGLSLKYNNGSFVYEK